MLDENSAADAAAGETQRPDAREILEVFGAAPLIADQERDDGSEQPPPGSEPRLPVESDDGAGSDPPAGHAETRDAGSPAEQPVWADLGQRLDAVEQALQTLSSKASFLPPKLRGLGEKVDSLATVLADARCRALLLELCGLDDLVRAGMAAADEGDHQGASRILGAVGSTLATLLENQGLSEIRAEGTFDPSRHQAVRQLPVDEACFDGVVLELDRRGFAIGDRVLRFAEVAVGRHVSPDDDPEPQAPESLPSEEPSS